MLNLSSSYCLFFLSCLIFCFQEVSMLKCKCRDQEFCSAVENHSYIVEAKVKQVADKQDTIYYRIQVLSTIKGQTKKMELISATKVPLCQQRLKLKGIYLLFLIKHNQRFWLSSCFNSKWSSDFKKKIKACTRNGTTDCPTLDCPECRNGYVLDENHCPTCECIQCPDGISPVQCQVRPCSLQSTQCPDASSCIDDYCGACTARYYDDVGNEICVGCSETLCSEECEYGYKNDSNGCQTCVCNECSNGEPPSECLVQPCSQQAVECPEAAACINDYCGCIAHFFDESGNEICTGCPQLDCVLDCEYGYQKDDKGCEICLCNECPHEEPYDDCLIRPCSRQSTECPQAAWCIDDYCRCEAHYFDDFGNQTCTGCGNMNCSILCEYGYKTDRRGCQICECLVPVCSDGGDPVTCESNPCSIPTDCPGATTCVPNYCGGCHAFYYDAQGEPFDCLQKRCPPFPCSIDCADGYDIDVDGCRLCRCKISTEIR